MISIEAQYQTDIGTLFFFYKRHRIKITTLYLGFFNGAGHWRATDGEVIEQGGCQGPRCKDRVGPCWDFQFLDDGHGIGLLCPHGPQAGLNAPGDAENTSVEV